MSLTSSNPLDSSRKHKFDEVALEYDAVRPTYPIECIEKIKQYSEIDENSKILEIGCGTGQATQFFADCGYSVDCIDIGNELVSVAQKKFDSNPKITFNVTSFENTHFSESSFDLVFSATAFHWVDRDFRYKETSRILKPGGTLAVFWNNDTRKSSKLRSEIDAIYQEVDPSEPTDTKRQSDFKTATNLIEDEIRNSEFFKDIKILRHPWKITFSKEKYLRLLNTFSYHRSLPLEKKNNLFQGIGEIIDSHGGEITVFYENVLALARVRK